MTSFSPIDYLVIGHLTKDITPSGWKLGGTASYSALTAKALGLNVGIVTTGDFESIPPELIGVQVALAYSPKSSTFENIQTPSGRLQYLHHQADPIVASMVPNHWRTSQIVHLGPIMQEVSIDILEAFQRDLVGLTPQGWLRTVDHKNKVIPCPWLDAKEGFQKADVVILSNEDINFDESIISEYRKYAKILIVTEGFSGSRVYAGDTYRYFHAREETQVDPTGAGDIFSTCFFVKYHTTGNPWLAADFATHLASISVSRIGLDGVPNDEEIRNYDIKINEAL